MPKKYKTDSLAAAHEAALALFEAGLISKQEMGEYDEACLASPKEGSVSVSGRLGSTRKDPVGPDA